MAIVIFSGRNVKEYESKNEEIVKALISDGFILCDLCLKPMSIHSHYPRGIKETGEEITITMVWCSKCRTWHALIPDFLLPNKHYSANEIEGVIIENCESVPVNQIETDASESTVKRWIKHVGESIKRAISILKYQFGKEREGISEVAIDTGPCYSELEDILEMAPAHLKYSGNKLGLANLWLGKDSKIAYI